MRKIQLQRFGGPEVLEVTDHPEPVCPPDGYIVETRAIGLNYAELVERRGQYRKDMALPYEMGKEASGIVVERGPEATEFEVGDEAIVVRFDNGCYAERIAAREAQMIRPPRGLDFVQMAAFANTFGTAWYAMYELARIRPGESVLIQAAAGGVGTAAISLAKSFGCGPIIGTAGSPEKCALVERLGADVCVDYRRADFRDAVRELTGGVGIDYCLESVGKEVYDRSLESLAPLGRLVVIGFSSIDKDYAEVIPRLHPLALFHRSILVGGLNMDNLKYQDRREFWKHLDRHVEEHGIVPHVGLTLPFEEAAEAHRALEGRETSGKVVLVVDPS